VEVAVSHPPRFAGQLAYAAAESGAAANGAARNGLASALGYSLENLDLVEQLFFSQINLSNRVASSRWSSVRCSKSAAFSATTARTIDPLPRAWRAGLSLLANRAETQKLPSDCVRAGRASW